MLIWWRDFFYCPAHHFCLQVNLIFFSMHKSNWAMFQCLTFSQTSNYNNYKSLIHSEHLLNHAVYMLKSWDQDDILHNQNIIMVASKFFHKFHFKPHHCLIFENSAPHLLLGACNHKMHTKILSFKWVKWVGENIWKVFCGHSRTSPLQDGSPSCHSSTALPMPVEFASVGWPHLNNECSERSLREVWYDALKNDGV